MSDKKTEAIKKFCKWCWTRRNIIGPIPVIKTSWGSICAYTECSLHECGWVDEQVSIGEWEDISHLEGFHVFISGGTEIPSKRKRFMKHSEKPKITKS